LDNRKAHNKATIYTENPIVTECSRHRVYAVYQTGQECDNQWGFQSFWAAVLAVRNVTRTQSISTFHHMLHFLPPFIKLAFVINEQNCLTYAFETKCLYKRRKKRSPPFCLLSPDVCSLSMTFPAWGSAMQFPENREEVEEEVVTPLVTNIHIFIHFLHDNDIKFVVISRFP